MGILMDSDSCTLHSRGHCSNNNCVFLSQLFQVLLVQYQFKKWLPFNYLWRSVSLRLALLSNNFCWILIPSVRHPYTFDSILIFTPFFAGSPQGRLSMLCQSQGFWLHSLFYFANYNCDTCRVLTFSALNFHSE